MAFGNLSQLIGLGTGQRGYCKADQIAEKSKQIGEYSRKVGPIVAPYRGTLKPPGDQPN
jgi:hypothetical protein